MPTNRFTRSLVFAALAAAFWLPWFAFVAPLVGSWEARSLYIVAVAAAYVASIAASPAHGFTMGIAAGVAGCCAALLARDATQLGLVLAALLGAIRSGLLYPSSAGRALAVETLLLGSGLLFARFLASVYLFSTPLAVWGFFLVQSTFFLIGKPKERRQPGSHPDAFEDAYTRATALMEEQ